MTAVVGRAAELTAIEALVDRAEPGAAALALDGEAGIGKTTVWLAAVERARQQGYRVLSCRPAENEGALPFVALGDLLEGVSRAELSSLTDEAQSALKAALGHEAPSAPIQQFAVARGAVELICGLAARESLVLAIDDVQWLDPQSEEVLDFVFRRLAALPIRLVVARRTERDLPPPLELTRAPDVEVTHLRLRAMELEELRAMLWDRLGLALPRPRLVELHGACGGNPFFALELARPLLDGARSDEPLTVPDGLADLVRRRLDALSEAARHAVLLTAASAQPTAPAIERAAGESDGLAEAVQAAVLELDGNRLRFTHPLLSATAYSSALPWERRDVHALLAAIAPTTLERAHHLARSTSVPDETVAIKLEEASAEAAVLGAPQTAARLMERASELSVPPDGEKARERLLAAAQLHTVSGDPARCRTILERVVATEPPGSERAHLLLQLADVTDSLEGGILVCEQALEEAGSDPALEARIYSMLSTLTAVVGQSERATEHARSAARLAEEAGDELLTAITLGDLCERLMMLGLPYAQADIERALEIEGRHDVFPAFRRPSFVYGKILGYTDSPDEARPLLRAEVERLERAGNESWQIGTCFRLADVELRAGNFAEAARLAARSRSIALGGGIPQEQSIALMMHGLVQAHIGQLEEARDAAMRAHALAVHGGDRAYAIRSLAVLGFVELSRGDAAAAREHLSPAVAELRSLGVGEFSVSQVVQNEIEALVALGLLVEAEETIALVEEKGRPTGRAWHAAVAARGRALVASARGEVEEAWRHLDGALAAHERLPQPFELGRTLLAQGAIERRAKRRGDARSALTRALELFDTLGAPRWAEKAATELARIPGRAPGGNELSETQRRIAELVAEGLANKEIAARLFLTLRTVESSLSTIYAKLGVRSRTELARWLMAQSQKDVGFRD